MVKKETRGRPKGEPTTLINFRVPLALAEDIKRKYKGELNERFNKWLLKLNRLKNNRT